MNASIVPQMDEVSKSIESSIDDIGEIADVLEDLKVRSQADLIVAVEMTAIVKETKNALDEKRKTWVTPLMDVIDDINKTFSPSLVALDYAEDQLKEKIEHGVTYCEKERMQLLARVEHAPEQERSGLITASDALVLDKVPGLSIRRTTKGTIVNEIDLINWAIKTGHTQILRVDVKAVNAMLAAFKPGQEPSIPGWEMKEKRTIAITVSKVEK